MLPQAERKILIILPVCSSLILLNSNFVLLDQINDTQKWFPQIGLWIEIKYSTLEFQIRFLSRWQQRNRKRFFFQKSIGCWTREFDAKSWDLMNRINKNLGKVDRECVDPSLSWHDRGGHDNTTTPRSSSSSRQLVHSTHWTCLLLYL